MVVSEVVSEVEQEVVSTVKQEVVSVVVSSVISVAVAGVEVFEVVECWWRIAWGGVDSAV